MQNESQSGFTVLDLLITIVVVAIVGAVLSVIVFNPKSIATQSANHYIEAAKTAGVDNFTLLDCMSADNDGDGKISCTVVNKKTERRQLLLCESTLWAKVMGGSCADPKPFTINNNSQIQ